MAQVFSNDRPLFANGAQTPMYKVMQDYAHKPDVQELLQKLCSDLFTERPENPLEYIASWVNKERDMRQMSHKQ